jgi:hypothetical protein
MPIVVLLSLASLALGGCAPLRLPDLHLRAMLRPAQAASAGRPFHAEESRLDVALVARFAAPPEALPELASAPDLGPPAPCRVSAACAWERRAAAEARARVIGAAP